MQIAFTYDKKQVIQALRYHFFTRPEIRILVILVNVCTIAAAILLYFKKVHPLSFVFFSTIWMILMLVIWRLLPNSVYKQSKTFKDDFLMQFREEDVQLDTGRGTQHWNWNRFSKFVETPYFFHLYFDNRSFFLVPKDAFSTITEQQEVRDLIKRKIKH